MRPSLLWARHSRSRRNAPDAASSSWEWPEAMKYAHVTTCKSVDATSADGSSWWARTRSNLSRFSSNASAQEPPADEAWIPAVLRCTWAAGSILMLNLLLTLIAVGISYARSANQGTFLTTELYKGHCARASHWATGFHLAVNLLLEFGSYVMQCLVGPSRTEVDEAHRKRRWLDIGVMSVRNFRVMSLGRKLRWFLLLVSSIPIHMIYNSVIFNSISALDYGMILVPANTSGAFQNVSNHECLKQYNVESNTHRSTLVLIAERQYSPNKHQQPRRAPAGGVVGSSVEDLIEADDWMAGGISWTGDGEDVGGYGPDPISLPITRCMTKTSSQRCQLLFSPSIAVTVISLNLLQVVCMYWSARPRRSEIFLRVGDAIASFLARPDPSTAGQALLSRADMTQGPHRWEPQPRWKGLLSWQRSRRADPSSEYPPENQTMLEHPLSPSEIHPRCLPPRKRWFQATSRTRWALSIAWVLICILTPIFIHVLMETSDGWSLAEQWAMGFGQANAKTNLQFPSGAKGLLLVLILSNTPQLLFSILNLLCSSVLSCMLVTAEYNDYATDCKAPARVLAARATASAPRTPCRSPTATASRCLAWAWSSTGCCRKAWSLWISPSTIFAGLKSDDSIHGCILLQGIALGAFLGLGVRRYRAIMPMAAHCSAAISAVCHPPADDCNAGLKPVIWGEVPAYDRASSEESLLRREEEGGAAKVAYAHCTFTSQDVIMPSTTRLYC
ncbi:hypothetical protein BO71DRAFT_488363 [Aspergillus ellipticus CBS 707.79]|uniref:DUF6536 domain-containing protein n=1 Tax=Aspergillus ellipticus CBS 707.79 TaxID=1448320 RepID=A0A319CUM1_9EURO|nr:hypothetical protein BO71DRAFT_488363 [Aspergillus ellipticus CBS 707.79]